MSALGIAMKTPPHHWTRAQLGELRNVELECLCQLLGVAHSGTKVTKIARLLDLAELRTRLASFERPDQLADRYRLRELQRMARRAGTYAHTTKYGVAAGLLQWRNEARQRGQTFYAELQAARARAPRQLRLPLDLD